MKIESEHSVLGDVAPVKGKTVRFVGDDGRTMFEVSCGDDGRSVEIRGVQSFKHDGIIYREFLEIQPRAANCVIVRTQKYE
jgi:hypothetical protein